MKLPAINSRPVYWLFLAVWIFAGMKLLRAWWPISYRYPWEKK